MIDDRRKWLGWGVLALASLMIALLLVANSGGFGLVNRMCRMPAVGSAIATGSAFGCLDYWLARYQTLAAGLLVAVGILKAAVLYAFLRRTPY